MNNDVWMLELSENGDVIEVIGIFSDKSLLFDTMFKYSDCGCKLSYDSHVYYIEYTDGYRLSAYEFGLNEVY